MISTNQPTFTSLHACYQPGAVNLVALRLKLWQPSLEASWTIWTWVGSCSSGCLVLVSFMWSPASFSSIQLCECFIWYHAMSNMWTLLRQSLYHSSFLQSETVTDEVWRKHHVTPIILTLNEHSMKSMKTCTETTENVLKQLCTATSWL